MAVHGLEQSLRLLIERARIVAGNLANANTPHYLRRDLPFHAVMQRVLAGETLRGTPVETDASGALRADGNNVSPERELAALNETVLLYRTTVQLLAKELALFRAAVTEGRR